VHGLPPPERTTTESVPMFCWPADAVRLPKSMFPLGSLNGVSRNTYELMRQIPEDRGHVAAASILIAGSERLPKFMLLTSVKSVFLRGFDVG
jgi:hypothetical protein